MTFSIGAFTCTTLLAQPLGYEGEGRQGLTARTWRISGLLSSTQWQSLLSVYDTWRNARILDPDTLSSGSIGTTVSYSGAANGVTWAGIACWFAEPPQGEQAGNYIQASVLLVDAAQALEVLRNSNRINKSNRFYFGTVTLGTTTLDLLRPMETYQDTPSMALTTTGVSYITGPLTATKIRNVEGETDSAGWTAIQSWYETTIASVPAVGTYFPISAPTASAEARIVSGARSDIYTVSVTLGQVR
jgi:hypothetical protein|tara:strand:+ start:9110 stop:9844 length:735 start_codon:yes stop_codon:yes gene_type:complete